MTPKERRNPDVLKASRKRRITAGSGVKVEDVNKLLKQRVDGRHDEDDGRQARRRHEAGRANAGRRRREHAVAGRDRRCERLGGKGGPAPLGASLPAAPPKELFEPTKPTLPGLGGKGVLSESIRSGREVKPEGTKDVSQNRTLPRRREEAPLASWWPIRARRGRSSRSSAPQSLKAGGRGSSSCSTLRRPRN